jgi:hypothetical protein
MDFESDVAYVVVEYLAKRSEPASQQEILREAPFEKRKVAGVLFAMSSFGFLSKSQEGGQEAVFSLTKSITAYHIIKLGEMGLDLTSLAGLVKISDRQRQAAMALAMQTEKLAELDEAARAKRAEVSAKSNPVAALPRDSIVDTLERLALASDMSIKEMRGAKKGDEVVRALMDAKEQAVRALAKYQEQLSKAGPEHLGF